MLDNIGEHKSWSFKTINMRLNRELLLIVAFSATNTVAAAASTTSGGHLRGPSVELEASPVERQLAPGNSNGCENGGSSNGNGNGPCKCPAPEDAVALLSGQECTQEGHECSSGFVQCCPESEPIETFCTCMDGVYGCWTLGCLPCMTTTEAPKVTEEPLV